MSESKMAARRSLPSLNVPPEIDDPGPEEREFYDWLDAAIANGLQNLNYFWGDGVPELLKTPEGRESIFAELNRANKSKTRTEPETDIDGDL